MSSCGVCIHNCGVLYCIEYSVPIRQRRCILISSIIRNEAARCSQDAMLAMCVGDALAREAITFSSTLPQFINLIVCRVLNERTSLSEVQPSTDERLQVKSSSERTSVIHWSPALNGRTSTSEVQPSTDERLQVKFNPQRKNIYK